MEITPRIKAEKTEVEELISELTDEVSLLQGRLNSANDKIDQLQQYHMEVLRDWASERNEFVKAVTRLQHKVAERDLRIR